VVKARKEALVQITYLIYGFERKIKSALSSSKYYDSLSSLWNYWDLVFEMSYNEGCIQMCYFSITNIKLEIQWKYNFCHNQIYI
jgi:hypothetical protein